MEAALIGLFGAPAVFLLFRIWMELHRANGLKEAEMMADGIELPPKD